MRNKAVMYRRNVLKQALNHFLNNQRLTSLSPLIASQNDCRKNFFESVKNEWSWRFGSFTRSNDTEEKQSYIMLVPWNMITLARCDPQANLCLHARGLCQLMTDISVCSATKDLLYDSFPTSMNTDLCMKKGHLRKWQLQALLVNIPCRAWLQDSAELFPAKSAFCCMCFFTKHERWFRAPFRNSHGRDLFTWRKKCHHAGLHAGLQRLQQCFFGGSCQLGAALRKLWWRPKSHLWKGL